MSTFENWAKQNLGVDEDGNIFFWRQKLSGRVRSAIGFTEFEECWQAALSSQVRLPEMYTSQMLISGGYEHGYNAAIDDMRKLNGLENV